MKYQLLFFALLGIGMTGCLDPISFRDPALIRWKGLSEDTARLILTHKLPLKTPSDSVQLFLKKQKLSFSAIAANDSGYYLTASTPILREKVMVKAKWLLQFHFGKDKKLKQIKVKKGLINFK